MNNNDEAQNNDGLLLNSTSSNKRSLTNHFVDYVKKTKYFVPCTVLSPSKTTIIDQSTKENQTPSSKIQLKKPIEQQPKRGKNIFYFFFMEKNTHLFICSRFIMYCIFNFK
jgi:hypothetical protein